MNRYCINFYLAERGWDYDRYEVVVWDTTNGEQVWRTSCADYKLDEVRKEAADWVREHDCH